jgi:hypothetical protein
MERISVTVVLCVALIAGIIWQAPPQVYKNVSSYYETFTKGRGSVQGTNRAQSPSRKNPSRKSPSKHVDDVKTASFNFMDGDTSEDRAEPGLRQDGTSSNDGVKAARPAAPARKSNPRQNPENADSKRN